MHAPSKTACSIVQRGQPVRLVVAQQPALAEVLAELAELAAAVQRFADIACSTNLVAAFLWHTTSETAGLECPSEQLAICIAV